MPWKFSHNRNLEKILIKKSHFRKSGPMGITVISILFVAKSDENAFQSRTKYFSGHDFEIRAKREF